VTYQIPPYKEPTNPVGTVAELFAGVGGFRVGLARVGWKTVYSNQFEPSTKAQHASDVYVANFGTEGHSNEDIAKVTRIPSQFDLLVGGFPCQDYSVAKSANSATGLEGKKGVLWWEILRLVIEHRPRFIFLENVDRLLKSPTAQRGRDFAVMLTTLGQAGYVIEWRVVNAADYGFPQRRIRVFIVGTRIDGPLDNPDPLQTIFQDGILATALPVEPNDAGIAQIEISSNAESVSLTFGQGLKFSPFANAGVFVNGTAHTAKVRAKSRRKPRTLGDVLLVDQEVPEEYWVEPSRVTEWEFLKGAKSLDRVHKESGFIYRYSEGSMAFPDHLDRPSRTILTAEGGSSASRFKHIIQIGTRFRRLVPVELERLSGFPDGWTNPPEVANISDSRRAFFIGNALVVGLIEMVGQELAKRVNRESS
jgi:DNA (cytosine-5)-methyltransferase 1